MFEKCKPDNFVLVAFVNKKPMGDFHLRRIDPWFFIVLEPKASKGHHHNFAFIFGDVQCSYDKLARYVRWSFGIPKLSFDTQDSESRIQSPVITSYLKNPGQFPSIRFKCFWILCFLTSIHRSFYGGIAGLFLKNTTTNSSIPRSNRKKQPTHQLLQ